MAAERVSITEKRQRKSYTTQFKAKIAMVAIKRHRTINEIASYYGLHPNLVNLWRRQAIDHIPEVFSAKRDREAGKRKSSDLGSTKRLASSKSSWTGSK